MASLIFARSVWTSDISFSCAAFDCFASDSDSSRICLTGVLSVLQMSLSERGHAFVSRSARPFSSSWMLLSDLAMIAVRLVIFLFAPSLLLMSAGRSDTSIDSFILISASFSVASLRSFSCLVLSESALSNAAFSALYADIALTASRSFSSSRVRSSSGSSGTA